MTVTPGREDLLAQEAEKLMVAYGSFLVKDTEAWKSFCANHRGKIVAALRLAAKPADEGVIAEIIAERRRQIDVEGYDAKHDDEHARGEIARAAACYAYLAGADSDHLRQELKKEWWGPRHSWLKQMWPWEWFYLKPKGRRNELICSAALLVAEIERLDRLLSTTAGPNLDPPDNSLTDPSTMGFPR